MKTLPTIKAWILICSIVVTSSETIEHVSSHHNVLHHGESISQKKHQNTIVPFGIQIPGHVLSARDVACISPDINIFEIMNKAQESCNGTDMRCTFYHFMNHEYQNIGTLDIDKELFDDLLMKFDNWLLTAENIEKDGVPLDGKTKEDSSLDTASINVNGSYSNEEQIENSTNYSETERLYTNPGVNIDGIGHNTNESEDDKIVNTHHIKKIDETHHRNHHHKWKNGNHFKLVPEYNNEHRYFEVFLPKDKETGKPRTIYVEVDRDKNEFVLIDEEIDKKLNGIKPIKIELDELSEIADTAFNNVAKPLNKKHHIYSDLNDDERVTISDVNTNSADCDDITNLDIDVEESTQNILNPSICNINANQQLIPDNTTGNVKKILNIRKNLALPNKYINQAQFYVQSQIANITDEIPNDNLELLENTNETNITQTGFYEETPLDTIEDHENNTSKDLDLDNIECSLENFDIPCENDNDNSTENYEPSTEGENVTFDDDSVIELEENHDTFIDIDFVDNNDFLSSDELNLNEPIVQAEKPVQKNKLKSTPYIYNEPKLTSSLTTGITDYTDSQLDAIASDNRKGSSFLQDHSPPPGIPSSTFTTVPVLGKYLSKALETDGHLKSSFPSYATLDLPSGASQNTPLNSIFDHPSITSYNSPLDPDFGHQTTRPKISTIFPSPPVEDPNLFQTLPSLSVDIQKPSLTTEPYHLEADIPMPPKPGLPSKLYLPNSNTDLDRISTTYQLSETPLAVMPDSFKDAVASPCPMQQIPPYLQPTKSNQDLGYINYSPFDNNSKETMIPCLPCKNGYPDTSIPSFANPYLKTPRFIPPYLEPLLPVAPLQPTSKIPTLDSLPITLDQIYPYPNGDYPREPKPVSLLPNTAFSPLNPLLLGPGFAPNTLPCQNLWNNIPYLPYTILPDQNIRNYPPIVNNYLTPSAALQQNQILKSLLSKTVSSSVPDQPCSIKNILEMTHPSYAPFSPVYTPPIQMNLTPTSALERDLQSLSLKYGIPLSKILNSLETEISDAHSKTSSQFLDAPYSDLEHDSSLISKPILSKTNAVLDEENRSCYEVAPLDSSLIGPHLELESSLMLEPNDSQSYTVLSETTVLPSSHSNFENEPTKVLKDSSLIGPHLSTLSTSNFVLSDENGNENEVLLSESDISNLSLPLDSSLIGPHLEIGSPPIVLDSINLQSDILTSHTEVPITISSQIEPKLNIQNQPTTVLLDSSLIGSHLLSSDDNQIINGMIPLETDLTDLTLLDSPLTQEDLVNQHNQSKILHHEKTAVPSIKLHKTTEYLYSNITEEEFLLESDSSRLIPLDSSLVGPGLKSENSHFITNAAEDKTVPAISLNSLQNTENKVEELESIILPSSLLPTLLKNPLKADSNLNIITQETNLTKELDKPSLGSHVDLPLTDISLIPFKETDFKIIEPISELPSLIDDSYIPLLTKDSRTLPHESKSSELTYVVDSETLLDNSLMGPSILHKLDKPEIFTSSDSSIRLDNSLIGPCILQEIDSREISPILDSVDQFQTSLAATTINQNKNVTEMLTAMDSSVQVDNSLLGPILHHEINSKETITAFDSFDKSLVPSLLDTKASSVTTSVLNSSQLDSSLIGPSLHQKTLDVTRAFDSKDLLDSSLVGPHLSTIPFSTDEIQMINEELQPESDLANLVPLDSSLVGPHVDFESELEQPEISRYQNLEPSLTSIINPDVCEKTELPCDLVEEMLPLEPITLPSICSSDLQELLSEFANAITQSQLSPSELKQCEKLLSSIAKISPDNKNVSPSCTELQTLTEYSPITMTSPTHKFSPLEPFVKLPPCLKSNYSSTPKTLAKSVLYAQGVPQIPVTPHSSFIQTKPLIDRNWLPQPLNFQNIHQTSPSFRPVVPTAPVSYISNAFTPEDYQPLLDLASHNNLYPQLTIPSMYTPGDAIGPEWPTPTSILPLDKYIPLLQKNNSPVLLSNLESTISNSEYNPIVVDDIMSLRDENSYQLLKDMSIFPFNQPLPPTIPAFENVSPSLLETVPILNSDFIKTRPLLPIPITNPLVPPSICNSQIRLHNPQNIPYMIQTPNISPCNLQPYSNMPFHSQFSEIVGPAPKLVTIPNESSKAFLQRLLSKPCVESPIILPSSSLDTMLKLPTASNELNSVPCQLPAEYFTPISPIYTKPWSNAVTNPILPIYASPLSVSYAKPISTPITSLPLSVAYVDSPLTPLSLPINPYTGRPLTPKHSSPVVPLKLIPTSDYPYLPTVAHNGPIPSEIPYKPSQTYFCPHLPIHDSPIPIYTSPGSSNIMSKLQPAMTSPISPVFYEPLSTPYFSPLPKSATMSLDTLATTPTGLLTPSYLSPDVPKYTYSPLPTPINPLKRPSNVLSPAFITPVSSNIPSRNTPLSLNPIFNLNPQLLLTAQELQTLRQMNSSPISNALNPFLNTNQRLPINTKTLPIQSYSTHVPKSSPLSQSQINQNIPWDDALQSNLLTSPLTQEIPFYDVIEENTCTYSNDKDEKYYEELSLKCPLESLSYTLAPEETTEALNNVDFIKQEDLSSSAPVNNRASEPLLQTKLYQNYCVTPYTPLHDKPLLKPLPAPRYLQPASLIQSLPQNVFDNTPLMPLSRPLKHPVSLPKSILSSALLKPLSPLTSAPNFPISSPLLPGPCATFSAYNILPMNKKPLIYFPYHSAISQDISSPLIDPIELRNVVTPQVTPVFSQLPTNAPFVPVSSPKSQPQTSPHILDNYIQLPSTHYGLKSRILTSQGSLVLVKPSIFDSISHYNQYVKPIISHIPPFEMPMSPQYVTPLTIPQNLKMKPLFSPQYMSSVSPGQTTLQDSIPLNEALIHHQSYIPQPAAFTSSMNNMFKSPRVTLPYTVLSSVNMIEPESTDLNRPQPSPFGTQYSLPSSFSPVPLSRPIVSDSNVPYSRVDPHIPKQAFTNHIIPSSLFMSRDTDFQVPTNKLSPCNNIPRKIYPSPSLIEPLETVPFYTPSRPLDMTANPQNIEKSKLPLSSVQYAVPLSSSPYFTQPLRLTDSYQTEPVPNIQYTAKPHPKLSPVLVQYDSPSLSPMYTSLPLDTAPKQLVNNPSAPQYNLPYVPVHDTPIHSSPSGSTPFINPYFEPVTEVPSYPVSKNIISSTILIPSEKKLFSNLRPLDISQDDQNLYSSPITSSTPLSPSSLLKPLAKKLPQKSRQYQPHIVPCNSHYMSQLPIESVPELLQSTSPLPKSSLLKPLFTTSKNNVPLLPKHFSNTNKAFPEAIPLEAVSSITSPDIALSNYLPFYSNHKYSGLNDSLVTEIPEILTPINPSSTTPYIFLKSPFNKQFKSPVSTPTNMPLYQNYDILESSPKLPIKANIINTDKPLEVSAISASESSPVSLNSLDTEMIEEIEPYELKPDLKDRSSQLPLGQNQQPQINPRPQPSYARLPLLNRITPIFPSKIPSFNTPILLDEAKLIDTTDFIPMSQIKSEPLISYFDGHSSLPGVSSTDRKVPIPNTLSNIPKPEILQLSPYTTLLNTEFPAPTYKQLPPLYSNQIPLPSPIYLSAQEYKDLKQGPSPYQVSSSTSPVLSSININPQLITNQLTGGPRPIPLTPFYNNAMLIKLENWLPSPIFKNFLPFHEKPLEVIPEKESTQTLNKYRPTNKITPLGENYPYEPKSTISEVFSELDSVKLINPLLKSKEPYTEFIEDLKSNGDNYNYPESDNVSIDENQPNRFETKSITKSLPEIIKGLSIPNYSSIAQRPERLSQLDHFYANNHIGKSPQVFTVSTYNTSPLNSPNDGKSRSATTSPGILKDFDNIFTTHFGSIPKLDTYSLRPNEYYPEIADSPENVPIKNSYPQNNLNPCLKSNSQIKTLNTIEITDTSDMNPTSYSPSNNIDDVKYSGYKTYQIPSSKSPQTAYNLGTPTQRYSPSMATYSSPSPSKVQQNPSFSHFYRNTEMYEPLIPQYQTPIKLTTPLQTKLGLDTLQESPELDEYDLIENRPISLDSINEDNELKTSLINYINKREDVKNNLFSNNAELTIPIGNIAITKKEPYNANTIETNNPSIGLKVWKSNVKIAEAELKLKFKDLSVNNFMPIVNNLDKYDMEEIRKVVKNYIDEKYGKHIEINEPYNIDNKYTVIKDFDHNAMDNKYNLLWPTNYV